MEKDFASTWSPKASRNSYNVSDKGDFKINQKRQSNFILIKGTIHLDEITIRNIHTQMSAHSIS
jgi:hypothetical protein